MYEVYALKDNLIDTYNIITPIHDKYQLLNNLHTFLSNQSLPHHKLLRINYLIQIQTQLSLLQLNKITDFLRENIPPMHRKSEGQQEQNKITVSVLIFENRREIQEHIEMMRQISSEEFEKNYLKLSEEVDKSIEREAVTKFCSQQLGWDQEDIHKFIEVDQIKTVSQLLSFTKFRPAEQRKIQQLKNFINFILESEHTDP